MEQAEIYGKLKEKQLNVLYISLIELMVKRLEIENIANVSQNHYFYFPKDKKIIELKISALKKAIEKLKDEAIK